MKRYKLCLSVTPGGTNLEAVEIRVKRVAALDVSDQTHGQLLVGLISDVHHGGHVYRQPIHSWKHQTKNQSQPGLGSLKGKCDLQIQAKCCLK